MRTIRIESCMKLNSMGCDKINNRFLTTHEIKKKKIKIDQKITLRIL